MITATKYRPKYQSSFGFRDNIKEKRSFETAKEAWDWVKQEKRYDAMADRSEGFTYKVIDAETGEGVADPSSVQGKMPEMEQVFKVTAAVDTWGIPVEEIEGRKIRRRTKETPPGMKNPLVFTVKAGNEEQAIQKVRKHAEKMEPQPRLGKIEVVKSSSSVETDNLTENNMEQKIYKVSFKHIEWDIGEYGDTPQAKNLPSKATVEVLGLDRKDAIDMALDRLSDDYGFLINQGFVDTVSEVDRAPTKIGAGQLKEMIIGFMRESLQEAEVDRKAVDDNGKEVNTDNVAFEPDKKTRPGTLKDVAMELGIITDKEKPFTIEDLDELEALGGKTAKRAVYAKAFLPVEKFRPKKVCR